MTLRPDGTMRGGSGLGEEFFKVAPAGWTLPSLSTVGQWGTELTLGVLAGFGLLILVLLPFHSPGAKRRKQKVGVAKRKLQRAQGELTAAKRSSRFV